MVTITISRQFGSGGSFVGKRLARRLGFKYVDREILRLTSKHFGMDERELLPKEEKTRGFWDNFFQSFSFGGPDAGSYTPPSVDLISDREFFETESQIIRKIATRYNAIIMGRAGYHVLKDQPGLVNFFLYAPADFRAKRIMEIYGIKDYKEALLTVEKKDKQREKFIRAVTGRNWTDACNFHLCIDTAVAGFSQSEDIIARFVEKMSQKKV